MVMDIGSKCADYKGIIDDFLSKGRNSFSISELSSLGISKDRLKMGLLRLNKQGYIYPLRRGYYIILSPEYRQQAIVPEYLFIDDLMVSLDREYYVSLLSAAALYGAGHQQPMSFYVTHNLNALRDIQTQKHNIHFINKKQINPTLIRKIKTKSGYMNVSTPEATMFDLVEGQSYFGLSRIYEVILELFEQCKISQLKATALLYPVATRQRLGFILDSLGLNSLSIYKSLNFDELRVTKLSLSSLKEGTINDKWKIRVNDQINIDL